MPNVLPGVKGIVSIPVADRFWSKVEQGESCWRWLGTAKSKLRPYGMVWVDGKHRPASQVAWSLYRGKPWPAGLDACHTCDNPGCVNPLHIFPGTPSMNAIDAMAKGRVRPPPNRADSTHCKYGHELTESNTIRRGNHRQCRTCRDRRNAERTSK